MILGANWTDCVFHDEDGRVGALLGGMVQEYRQMQFGSAEIFRGRLTEILILTLRKLAAEERTLHTGCEAVEKAILYINRHYAHDVTLQDFCAGEHYSVPYISRRFRQETGLTFREYLRRAEDSRKAASFWLAAAARSARLHARPAMRICSRITRRSGSI